MIIDDCFLVSSSPFVFPIGDLEYMNLYMVLVINFYLDNLLLKDQYLHSRVTLYII